MNSARQDVNELLVPIRKLVSTTPTAVLCKPNQDVVSLRQNQTIGDALLTLAKRGILSAPIVVEPDLDDLSPDVEESIMSPQLVGWLDVSDILRAFLDHLQRDLGTIPTKMLQLMTAIEKAAPSFVARTIITIPSVEDRNLLYESEAGQVSLLETIKELFLKPPNGSRSQIVHRVALFGPYGDITTVISQMDVIKYLHARPDELGPLFDTTLEALGVLESRQAIVSVDAHTPTLAAFAMLASRGLAGAPVLAPDTDELLANISISDLRKLTGEHLGVLALPVAEFLAVQHHTTYIGYSVHTSQLSQHEYFNTSHRRIGPGENDVALFTVTPANTFGELLGKFVERHVHRVYVIEAADRPKVCAVITLTDILRLIAA